MQAQEGMEYRGYELDKLSVADGGLYAGHDDAMQHDSDGTTIIAIKYNGGILLGADSRTSNVSDQAFQSEEWLTLNHVLCLLEHVHRWKMFGQA